MATRVVNLNSWNNIDHPANPYVITLKGPHQSIQDQVSNVVSFGPTRSYFQKYSASTPKFRKISIPKYHWSSCSQSRYLKTFSFGNLNFQFRYLKHPVLNSHSNKLHSAHPAALNAVTLKGPHAVDLSSLPQLFFLYTAFFSTPDHHTKRLHDTKPHIK